MCVHRCMQGMHVLVSAHMCMQVCVYIFKCAHVHAGVYALVSVHVCMRVCLYGFVSVHMCMQVCVHL